MRRIAVGLTVGLAVWFGSAVAAEAQWIQPTGPQAIYAGSTNSTLTATVYLPSPCAYRTRLWVYNGSLAIHYSEVIHANPGTNYSTLNRNAYHPMAPNAGDTLTYVLTFKVGTVWYDMSPNQTTSVIATRPSTKTSAATKSNKLSIQSVDRDRRRE